MENWLKTGCVLCAQNCGLEVMVENNRIVKVRPDKDNGRSEGYCCRKGLNIAFHQHNGDRLKHPLKKTGNGFEEIPWDQAIAEIAARLRKIADDHGPKALAYMGGGGQGCHMEAAFGVRLLRGLGSRYHYNALGQELTGMFWVQGRMVGRQYLLTIPDEKETDMLVSIGWNGMQSHQMPQARRQLTRLSRDPGKLLVVIDPRLSETAKIADIHLPVRPGADALLTRAMIAIIIQKGWHNQDYIERHTRGFSEIVRWFDRFDAGAAIEVCQLDYGTVENVCRLFATRRSSLHGDLGILMNRHSTVTSYLQMILLTICGRVGVPGGNIFPGHLMPLGAHSDERDPRSWKTATTGFPPIMGVYPPNAMPEEILSDHPERLRAVIVSGSNPLRSFADTSLYEKAFARLDLLVTLEMAMTETAALSHYVLPSRSAYESWDSTFFAWTYPGIFFQMRRPVVEPEGEPLELSEIHLRLADELGLIPDIPEELHLAAGQDRMSFGMALLGYIQANPEAMKMLPFILGKTLGRAMGSVQKAALWGLLQAVPKEFRKNAARAGFKPGLEMGEDLFRKIIEHPEGVWIGRSDMENNLQTIQTEDHKIELYIPELADWIVGIDATSENRALAPDPDFPLILMAGKHFDRNANTLMRDPQWNRDAAACTLTMHPEDAAGLNLSHGQVVRIITEAGEEKVELEVTDTARRGHVAMPHGFGLAYQGKVYGANVNRLTKNTHRDPLAGTPLHRHVPCRVEAA